MPARYQTITRRRRIFTICACIMLGVLTTWIVAWTLAAWDDTSIDPIGPRLGTYDRHVEIPFVTIWIGDWPARRWNPAGVSARSMAVINNVRSAEAMRPRSPEEQAMLFPGMPPVEPVAQPPMPEAVRRIRETWLESPFVTRTHVEYQYGWPFAALEWAESYESRRATEADGATTENHSGRIINDLSWIGRDDPLVLPVDVLWFGFIANTSIAAAMWAVPLIIFGAARRRRRIAKGCCPMCNYDLRGDLERGCSECGWRRNT